MTKPNSEPKVLLGIPNLESVNALDGQLSAAGCQIDRARTISECESLLQKQAFKLVVLDVSLNGSEGIDAMSFCRHNTRLISGSSVVIASSEKPMTSDEANQARSVGAVDVLEMPVNAAKVEELVRLAMEAPATEGAVAIEQPPLVATSDARDQSQAPQLAKLEQTLVGPSPAMAAIRQLILEVAPTRASVMIYGESGTGKELVAVAIHRYGKQSQGPFVPANMAAIPHGLAEGLLFGHEKDAVASAVHSQKGWCEAADGGTLFLDEVGDMEIQVQPKLLRFLQEGTLQRVGSQVSQRVAARVITATNRDPGAIVTEGRMREDLFFRLHVVPIYVPPLRDRPEDIPALAMLFLRLAAERHDRVVEGFSDDAMRVLQQHDWPGNVRQLENTVERLVIFARGRIIEADHIPADDHLVSAYAERRRKLAEQADGRFNGDDTDSFVSLTPIERHERAAIVDALRRVDGHAVDAARLLGLGQATVYRKIKQYSIPHERKRRPRQPR